MTIRHRTGSYDVQFCSMSDCLPSAAAWVVADANVAMAWPNVRCDWSMPPGEQSKSLETYGELVSHMAAVQLTRSATVAAVGGGVAGDLVGFAAATYMRGVAFVQIPTTLLAMVDSSVGGKVGIDLPTGKNLVGAFWAPQEVRVPLDALQTLPHRHFTNGMAEVWKYAFILDPELGEKLAASPLTATHPNLEDTIRRCIKLKAKVVEADELDVTGARAILNFGHTIGHAIEQVTGYREFLHGEAIAIGMVAEARLGENLGVTRAGTADYVQSRLESAGLPTAMPDLSIDSLLRAARLDKKNDPSGLAASLLTDLGQCKLTTGIAEGDFAAVLRP